MIKFCQASINIVSDIMSGDMVYTENSCFLSDYLHQNKCAVFSKTEKTWELYCSMINDINIILNYIKIRSDAEDRQDIKAIKGQALAQRAYA